MSIVQSSDFTGEYKISTDKFSNLTAYIDKFEKFYLVRLLGADLYDLFIADLTVSTPQVPQTSPYTEIYAPFHTDDNGCLRISEGMVKMLVQFIYFHYLRDNLNKKTTSGVVQNMNENSTEKGYTGFNLVQSYNEGVENYQEIEWYICDNETDDYPTYNGVTLDYTSGI